MTFVLDASIALGWTFDDEDADESLPWLDRLERGRANVPSIFWFEVANALLAAERRGRLARPAEDTLGLIASLPIDISPTDGPADAVSLAALARRHGLSAYDAAYLSLAMRSASPLATRDASLRRAALAEHVQLSPRPTA